jgi:Holliday junction resolvase
MGKSQRTKGAAGERELAKILADTLGVTVKRNLSQSRDAGDDITIGRLRIEVKRCQTLAIPAWTRQIEAACGLGDVPIIAFRQDGQPWRVVMLLDDWLPLIREEVK